MRARPRQLRTADRRRRRVPLQLTAGLAVALGSLAGCISTETVRCAGGRICPAGTVCDPLGDTCIDARAPILACEGVELEGAICTYPGAIAVLEYHCRSGVCVFPYCGDRVVDHALGEDCDGEETASCPDIDQTFDGGTASCTERCAWDTSACTKNSLCGNGRKDDTEECDAGDLGGADCGSLGFDGGTLGCTADCSIDTTGCTRASCGNATIDPGEQCDGADLAGATCESEGFGGGQLACAGNCAFDVSGCAICGDGQVEGNEQCDGNSPTGQTCSSLGTGFTGGQLACSPTCQWDTTQCYKVEVADMPLGAWTAAHVNLGCNNCTIQPDCGAIYQARATAINGNAASLEFRPSGPAPTPTGVNYWIAVGYAPQCSNLDTFVVRAEGVWGNDNPLQATVDIWPTATGLDLAPCNDEKPFIIITGDPQGDRTQKTRFQFHPLILRKVCN